MIRIVSPSALCACALLASACTQSQLPPNVGTDTSSADIPPEPEPKNEEPPPPPPDDVVEKAALPFHGERTSDGAKLTNAVFFADLARADAICVGERHDQPTDHFAELAILRALEERQEVGGFELGVGFEMFEQDSQGALDQFSQGRIDLERLVKDSKYDEEWGFPIQYYAPLLQTAQKAHNPLLALNIDRRVTRNVAESGIDELPEHVGRHLPEMDLDDRAHRAMFDGLMAGHPGDHGSAEHMYEAQVLWDESMAENAARWLVSRAPARKLVIFAGRAHCFDPAIPNRMKRRGVARVVSVLPMVEGEQPAAVALTDDAANPPAARAPSPEAEGRAEAALRVGYDYHFVMTRK